MNDNTITDPDESERGLEAQLLRLAMNLDGSDTVDLEQAARDLEAALSC